MHISVREIQFSYITHYLKRCLAYIFIFIFLYMEYSYGIRNNLYRSRGFFSYILRTPKHVLPAESKYSL